MPSARLAGAGLALALLLAPVATASADVSAPAPGDHRAVTAAESRREVLRRDPDARGTVSSFGTAPQGSTFTGFDGQTYETSPPALRAADGTYFYGQDFDLACQYEPLYRPALKRLDRLANLIRQSGRTVQYTVAPNKSSVQSAALATVALPHGTCDSDAINANDRLLDEWDGKAYVPMQDQLHRLATRTRPYWQVDTHWNTVGAVAFTKRLAARLDPRLANRQRYVAGEETYPDDLYRLGYADQEYDVGPSLTPLTRVRVEPAHGSPVYDSTGANASLSWKSHPAGRTWNGKTLLAGDSFFFRGLGSLMPLFRTGEFFLVDPDRSDELAAAIASSRTVVLEVVERYLPFSLLASSLFYDQVRHALRRADR